MDETQVDMAGETTDESPSTPAEAGEMFLSPRVINQDAFEDYSAKLRELLDAADVRTTELKQTINEASASQKASQESQNRHKSQLEIVTKLLRALTAKSEQVNTSLERIEQKASRVDHFEETANSLLAQLSDRVENQATSPTATPEATPETDDIVPLLERAESMRTEIELSIRRLTMLRDDARGAAHELASTLGGVLEAMEEIPERSAQPASTFEQANELVQARASLQATADRFRKEIDDDLSKMALAMKLIATQGTTDAPLNTDTSEASIADIQASEDASEIPAKESHSPVSPGMPLS